MSRSRSFARIASNCRSNSVLISDRAGSIAQIEVRRVTPLSGSAAAVRIMDG
jgi:hypothetical protein